MHIGREYGERTPGGAAFGADVLRTLVWAGSPRWAVLVVCRNDGAPHDGDDIHAGSSDVSGPARSAWPFRYPVRRDLSRDRAERTLERSRVTRASAQDRV